MVFKKNGKQIAPCIVSKARYALGVPNRYSGNKKKCSLEYWETSCRILGEYFNCSDKTIEQAISKYNKV